MKELSSGGGAAVVWQDVKVIPCATFREVVRVASDARRKAMAA